MDEEKVEAFRTTTAQGLILTKMTWPYISTCIAHLCTRVKETDTDDWEKQLHFMKYLYGTR